MTTLPSSRRGLVGGALAVSAVAATSSVNADGPANDPAYLNGRAATIQSQLALYNETDRTYNNLCKAIALAGAAPAGYISPNVAPGILQGPGVTDQVGGVTIPRADLYYAHDVAAQMRQSLRDGGTPALPAALATNPDIKADFDAYVSAFKAMPTFAGPIGMNLQGSPARSMSMLDANALQSEADAIATQLTSTAAAS